MPASMESLGPELLDQIVYYLCKTNPNDRRASWQSAPSLELASYACISRKWQAAVERYTFSTIKTFSTDFPRFKQIVTAPRQRLVKELWYDIDLPLYSADRAVCLERPSEHKANLAVFQKELSTLWAQLALWRNSHDNNDDGENTCSGIHLVLKALVPTHRVPGPDGEQVPPGIGGQRWWIPEHSLKLKNHEGDEDEDGDETLPPVSCITSLELPIDGQRLHPTAISAILRSLPGGLKRLKLGLLTPHAQHKALQVEHRIALARALQSPTLRNLESLSIYTERDVPRNHSFDPALSRDPAYPEGDELNHAVRKLATTSLRELKLTGSWLMSPVLWAGLEDGGGGLFPYLENVRIQMAPFTYDGRWYFTGDRRAVEPNYSEDMGDSSDDDDDDDDDDDNEVGDDIGGEEQVEDEEGASFNLEYRSSVRERRNAIRNGSIPSHPWRTTPDPELFDPLVWGLARAVFRMPRLDSIRLCTEEMSGQSRIDFECIPQGAQAETVRLPSTNTTQQQQQQQKRRWIVTLESEVQWDVPRGIMELLQGYVGDDGEVSVYKY